MERYYDEDPDNSEEPFFNSEDEEQQEENAEAVAFIDQQTIFNVMQIELAQAELTQHLLSKAMDIAKQSWLWPFKNSAAKMAEIEVIYKKLIQLTDEDEEPKEEQPKEEQDNQEGN